MVPIMSPVVVVLPKDLRILQTLNTCHSGREVYSSSPARPLNKTEHCGHT